MFRNSQGEAGRGALIHLTRNQAVFEVYNPYSIVQLSEVLDDVRVLRGERAIYRGRAVVSNMVPTGVMVIVSATLVDPWSDLEGLQAGQGLEEEVRSFVADWEVSHRLRPSYQLSVSNLRAFLGELSRWLGQVEVTVRGTEPESQPGLQEEFVEEVGTPLTPKLGELYAAFEDEASRVPEDQVVAHKAFARKEIHPLTLCAPFVHRTFTKPLGYAGDYEMVNMMLRNGVEGPNTYARVLNSFNLKCAPAEAHRNRIEMLVELLEQESGAAEQRGAPFRVLNIGCGPAEEVQRILRRGGSTVDRFRFHLLDFNQETLDFARRQLEQAARQGGAAPGLEFIHNSIHDLLKEARAKGEPDPPRYEMVYCAGLFDYLSDRICKRLIDLFLRWTVPGGLVVVTNVHTRNPNRFFMEHIFEWYLTYRDDAGMLSLSPEPEHSRLACDPTGVNIFLHIRKPDR